MDSKLTEVRQGMRVLDAGGEQVGIVDEVKMGDPAAVTAQGQRGAADSGLGALIASVFGGGPEPRVPREQAERMLRLGYIKIDKEGFLGGHQYVAADGVDRVEGDTVLLAE